MNNSRFSVEVSWRDFEGGTGSGRVVPGGSSDSTNLWFFASDNWEMLVKVLDGCSLNDHFWVLAASATNVEYTLSVTDSFTGELARYDNQLGVSSPAIIDTEAFDVCDADPPEPGGKPTVLPSLASLQLYSPSSPLATSIAPNPPIDTGSGAMIDGLLASGGLVVSVRQYSSPVFFADASTARVEVQLPCGETWELGVSKLIDVPIPAWAEPAFDTDGAGNPPVGCGEESDQDNHMVVLELDSRCEYDFWQARRETGVWVASWATAISMESDGIYPDGLSTRGSGFAFLGGVIWPDELAAGRIEHALVFAAPLTRSGGPVAPATDSDGEIVGSRAIPEGARLQLDPALDLDTLQLEPWERTIAKALQVYGMYLVDNGGTSGVGLFAIDPRSAAIDPWRGLLPEQDYVALDGIPIDRLRVLELPPQNATWQDSLRLPSNPCAFHR